MTAGTFLSAIPKTLHIAYFNLIRTETNKIKQVFVAFCENSVMSLYALFFCPLMIFGFSFNKDENFRRWLLRQGHPAHRWSRLDHHDQTPQKRQFESRVLILERVTDKWVPVSLAPAG
jgi:hypothetical protein